MKITRTEILGRLGQSSRVNCLDWRGSPIRSGDNVMIRLNEKKPLQPGQIIDIQDYRDIRKAERMAISSKPKNGRERMVLIRHRRILSGKEAPPRDSVHYCQVPDSLKEVTDTVDLEWVPSSAVMSPCFIFHADTIQRGLFTCKGMERVFLIRYYQTRNGKFIQLREKDWHPFYRHPLYPLTESYPENLWNYIVTVKNEVQKAMSRGGHWDGRTVSAKILGAPPSLYGYLKDELEAGIGNTHFVQSASFTRVKKTVYDNLSVNKRRLKVKGHMIRILGEDELDAVRKLFGATFAVGITNAVPSKRMLRENPSLKPTVYLRNTDVVRMVTCSRYDSSIDGGLSKPIYTAGEFQPRPMTQQCSYRGIDFRYNQVEHGIPELLIQCRFVKVPASCVLLKDIMCRGNTDGNVSDSDSSSVFVSKGDYLTLEGSRVYLVSDIGTDGTVRCVSPANAVNDPIDITMEEAIAGLLRQCR